MESGMINIPPSITDANYRYKMPKIRVVTQGSGNGIKTKMENIVEISKCLNLPPDYPLKFIAKEIGTQAEVKNDNYLLNGQHEVSKLLNILEKFIKSYVLCPVCKLPEILISIKKNEIRSKCKACGKQCKLDEKHKFANHIKNFPPKYDEAMKKLEVKVEDKPTVDKKIEKKQKAKEINEDFKNYLTKSMKQIEDSTASDSTDKITETITSIFQSDTKVPIDVKWFLIVHGIFGSDIYRKLRKNVCILQHFFQVFVREKTNEEEIMFHLVSAVANLVISRFKKENLQRYVSSILYVLYDNDILTEDYYLRFVLKGYVSQIPNQFIDKKTEDKFIAASDDFVSWLQNAPYEDEPDSLGDSKAQKQKDEQDNLEMDIDDI